MSKILISKAFSFFILKFVLSLTNGTTYQGDIVLYSGKKMLVLSNYGVNKKYIFLWEMM